MSYFDQIEIHFKLPGTLWPPNIRFVLSLTYVNEKENNLYFDGNMRGCLSHNLFQEVNSFPRASTLRKHVSLEEERMSKDKYRCIFLNALTCVDCPSSIFAVSHVRCLWNFRNGVFIAFTFYQAESSKNLILVYYNSKTLFHFEVLK